MVGLADGVCDGNDVDPPGSSDEGGALGISVQPVGALKLFEPLDLDFDLQPQLPFPLDFDVDPFDVDFEVLLPFPLDFDVDPFDADFEVLLPFPLDFDVCPVDVDFEILLSFPLDFDVDPVDVDLGLELDEPLAEVLVPDLDPFLPSGPEIYILELLLPSL